MSYNIRNPLIEELLRRLGKLIHEALPTGWGFTLMLYSYDDTKVENGGMFYISSAEREDMIKAMEEFIARNRH